tara:strand:+ start:1467 stop:1757 length:291 start_codon:yes stop_codon:yes gene_type:complete
MLNNIIFFVKNKKYLITSIIFLFWILFVSNPSILKILKSKKNIQKIEKEINYYSKEISKDSTSLDKIKNDTLYMIKFARENYLMKKENEDIFIINK